MQKGSVSRGAGKSTKKNDMICASKDKKRSKRDSLALFPEDTHMGIQFDMDQGSQMVSFSTTKDRLFTEGLGGCSVAVIASPLQALAVHSSRGRYQVDANGQFKLDDVHKGGIYVAGYSAVEMGVAAANQLVALWRANRVPGVAYKAMLLTNEESSQPDGNDEVANAMWPILNAAVGNCAWQKYDGPKSRLSAAEGILRVTMASSGHPTVQLGTGQCGQWA
jgi:hypothetical protein